MEINRRNSPLFAIGKAKWEAFVNTYTGPYDLTPAVYAGMNRKLSFTCPTHGAMQMDAKNMMVGRTCNLCALAARGKPRFTLKKALARFIEAHGATYDYSNVVYKTQQTPVDIICSSHGVFRQKPEFHWSGSGCPQCFHEQKRGKAQADTIESFAAKLEAKFPNQFEIIGESYIHSQAAMQVRCIKHDQVCDTKPNYLMNGCNPCTKCNRMKSHEENAVFRFISNLAPAQSRDRTVIKPKELDILLPVHKLAIEYCGMYWHSSGNAEETRNTKSKHIYKYKACNAQGIRLITLYETEWKEHNYAVRRLLRNAVGKSKGKLMARKCGLHTPTNAEAKQFYDRYHPQGGEGSGEHFGLYWNDKLVACMRFVLGANDRGNAANRVWTLSRYATRVTVSGAASRLFKAFVEEFKPSQVKSFSDNRFFEGGMYTQLGFELEADVIEDYQVWSPKIGLLPKSHYQRRNLPRRLEQHGLDPNSFDPETDKRSEADMTYLMGARRIYDCGKKRWMWRPQVSA